jgi:hypothetical protein
MCLTVMASTRQPLSIALECAACGVYNERNGFAEQIGVAFFIGDSAVTTAVICERPAQTKPAMGSSVAMLRREVPHRLGCWLGSLGEVGGQVARAGVEPPDQHKSEETTE